MSKRAKPSADFCSVRGCLNNSISNPDDGFFSLPSKDMLNWLRLMGRVNLKNKIIPSVLPLKVCEKHFQPNEIAINEKSKSLISNTIVPQFHLPVKITFIDDSSSSNDMARISESPEHDENMGLSTLKTCGKQPRREYSMLHTEIDIKDEITDGPLSVEIPLQLPTPSKRPRLENMLHTEIDIKEENNLCWPSALLNSNDNEIAEELKLKEELNTGEKSNGEEESSSSNKCNDNEGPSPLFSNSHGNNLRLEEKSACEDKHNIAKTFSFSSEQKLLIPAPKSPFEYFELFFSDSLLTSITNGTNRYRFVMKKRMTLEELKVFFGLLLHMGSFKLEGLKDYWRTDKLLRSFFHHYMEPSRFMTILTYLCPLSEPNSATDGSLLLTSKFRPVLDHFNDVMNKSYQPGKDLMVEEYLWENDQLGLGTSFLNLPEKKKDGGLCTRLNLLREPCGTIIRFHVQMYTHNNYSPFEEVLFKMVEDKLDVGRSLYLQSHQISYELLAKLLERKTHCTGRLLNMLNLPKSIAYAQLNDNENKSLEITNGIHMGKLRSKDKEVFYLTTESPKKSFVDMYNKTQFNFNSLVSKYYPLENTSMSWHVKMIVHILVLSLINAHSLFNKFSGKTMDYDKFRMNIIKTLLPDLASHATEIAAASVRHRLDKVTGCGPNPCSKCFAVENKYHPNHYECRACPGLPIFCVQCFCDVHC